VATAAVPAVFGKPQAKPQLLDNAVLRISDDERIGDLERISDGERRWGVQVGAYRNPEPALGMATTAATTASDLLRSGTITVVERTDSTRSFYLARIHGLTRNDAEAACTKLRRNGIDCLIVQLVKETHAGWDIGPMAAGLQSVLATPEAGGSAEDSDWGIQVGAFPASAQARSTAQKAMRALPETLEPGVVQIIPVATEKHGTVYRARIVGIDKNSAAQACRLLSLEQFACMVVRVEDSLASVY
jgi:hypothetical protein